MPNAELKLEWARRLINVVCGDPNGDGMTVTNVGMGYAEPGYHDNVTTWVLGSWWVRDKETGELEMHPITKAFDRLGITWDFYDEWDQCSHCWRIFRSTGDSYFWKRFGVDLPDGDRLCGECVVDPEFLPDVLQEYVNNPHNRVAFCDASHLEALGWVRYNADRKYQAGAFEGMRDNPGSIAEMLKVSHPNHDFVFYLDEPSQFYIEFSVFLKERTEQEDDE